MKQALFTIFLFTYFITIGETYTSISSGNWSLPATWDKNSVPTSGDDVIISSGHTITLSATANVSTIEVRATDASNFGSLIINTGADLTTTSHTEIFGCLNIIDGVFNAGNSSGDKLTVNGSVIGSDCYIDISGGTLNISRYFTLKNGSTFTMSGGIINVNSSGGSSATDIFNIPSATTFSMSSGSINILNGNLGTGVAVKFNPTTSSVTGGTISFLNTKGYEQTIFVMDADIYNIICDVGESHELIIENMETSTIGFSCNDLTITSGKTKVNVGTGITVDGSISDNTGNSDGLVITSNANGNGSLIPNGSISGNVTVERWIDQYLSNDDGWHIISSPVDNMSIGGSDFEPGSNDDLFRWDESQNTWLNYKIPANNITNFQVGYGYMVAYESATTKKFIGSVNQNDVTYTNLSFGPGDGWQLLGNPFSSALRWGSAAWNLNNVGGVAKVWDESAGNYADIIEDQVLPSTNGFFIQVSSASNSITIPATERIHSLSSSNYKSIYNSHPEHLFIKVTNSQNSYTDQVFIGFKPDATMSFDLLYDSRKLPGNHLAPQLYINSDDEFLSTGYFPILDSAISIDLYLEPASTGIFSLQFSNLIGFSQGHDIILEDKYLNSLQNILKDSIYTFEAKLNDYPDRFVIHFANITGHIDKEVHQEKLFYSHGKIYFENPGSSQCFLKVYNTLGKIVHETGTDLSFIDVSASGLKTGYYIIHIQDKDKQRFKTIFINTED